MNVFDLMAKIGLDDKEYNEGLDKDEGKWKSFGNSLASGAKTIAKAGVTAFAAIGTAIGGATVALVSNAKETAAYADNIDKMSQKMGFSAEKFQEWDFIMQHNGSSIEAVKSSMIKLDKALESDTDAWKKLGLSQEELLNMSADEKFEATVKALQGVTDETEKAALAQDIFGKSYQEMMPLLNSSAEDVEAMKQQVHDLGGVMSDDAVKAGAAFQDSLQNLNTALTGAKNNLMANFLPSLTTVMDGLSALFSGDDSGLAKIKQGIEDFASKLNEKLPKVLETAGGILESLISALPSFIDTIAQQLPSLISTLIPVLINAVVSLADAVVTALPQIMEAINKNINVISSGLTKIFQALGKIILKLVPTLLPVMLKVGLQLIVELAKGISENASEVIKTIIELVNMLVEELTNPDTLMTILECGLQILTAIVNGIAENLPLLLETLGTLIINITTFLVEAIPELVVSIGQNGAKIITDVLPQIILSIGEAGGKLLTNISETIAGWIPDIIAGATTAFEAIGDGITAAWDWIKEKVGGLAEDILDWIGEGLKGMFDIGKNLVEGLWDGIKSMGSWIEDKIGGFCDDVVSFFKNPFGIFSPSKKTRWMGQMLDAGLVEGVVDDADATFKEIQDTMEDGIDGIELDAIDLNAVGNVGVQKRVNTVFDVQNSLISRLIDTMNQYINMDKTEVFPIIIGGRTVDEFVLDAKRRLELASGGQVNV